MCGYSVPNYPEQAIQEKLYVISLACPRQKDARRGTPSLSGQAHFRFPRFLLRILRLLAAPVVTGMEGLNFGFLVFSGVSQTFLDFLSNLLLLPP